MTSTPPTTSTSLAVQAAGVYAHWSQVPARINQSSIVVVDKAVTSAGWISTAAAAAAVSTVIGSVMANGGAKLATMLTAGVDPGWAGTAATLGLIAGAAPAVAGWVSAMISKDGGARGILEGTGVATAYFVGLLGGVASGWGEGAVWLAGVSGGLAAIAYAAGVLKRM